jgi:hypothetical protein
MGKIKKCASNRYCRVRSFVQFAGVVLAIAIVAILLLESGVISV